ncbi:FtsH protease activity modulator HflK [Methylobacter sp. YRD-M1]|uniref:FtsH protease activity modulator HflK n=1 Tax=Methylobacter sp. YRD-M1 TaxID=2911520 RepID=UPI00227B8CF4|nr:FtsH protease activity modulator HflK [Methylobacter sp. YRD-M1]WAK03379.1 FtsH protease activity modulator HflK [Methylobacter sp. YRD-M1]
MSWNEPGGDKKDPWSGRGDQKGPPDLDEAIRSLQEKLGRIFGGGKGGGEGSSGGPIKGLGFWIAGGAVLVWGLFGFYTVDAGNQGVETRFGKYTVITEPGLNWHFPAPIEHVDIINVKQQRYIEVGYRSAGSEQTLGTVPKEALMLTKDENIVDVRLAVQYQIKDAKQFLFNVANPVATLKQATESATRGVVGSSKMDFVLTEGRSEVVAQIKKEIQDIMDNYQSGIQITSVNLQDAQPPEQVQSAFEDAIKAREDQQRLINEAEAYSNDVVPKARGAAARAIQEAEGYKEQVIARAEGEANRFSKLLAEYKKAPEVTRQRLYLESMESVLSETNTVMVDTKGSNNVLYLPIDKMTQQPPSTPQPHVPQSAVEQPEKATSIEQPALRTTTRGRDARGRQ